MALPARTARLAEWAFAGSVLLWLTEAYGPWRRQLLDRDWGHVLFALSLWLLLRRWRELRALLAAAWPLLLLVALAALSPLWSIGPQDSLRAAVALEASTAFGLWLALRFPLAQQQQLVALALALCAAGSALLALVFPEIGVMQKDHAGAWNGLFIHKNHLAWNLALGVLACGLLALGNRRARTWAGASAGLSLLMLGPARSAAGAASLGLASLPVGVAAWLQRLRRPARGRALLLAAAGLSLGAALALANASALLGAVGRDTTLTQRTQIWTAVMPALAARPWLGHGLGALWESKPDRRAVTQRIDFDPVNAHSGLLDLALDLGAVGFALFCVPYGLALARAVRFALAGRSALRLWPLAFLAWLLASNLAESSLVHGSRLGWVMLVATAAALARRDDSPMCR